MNEKKKKCAKPKTICGTLPKRKTIKIHLLVQDPSIQPINPRLVFILRGNSKVPLLFKAKANNNSNNNKRIDRAPGKDLKALNVHEIICKAKENKADPLRPCLEQPQSLVLGVVATAMGAGLPVHNLLDVEEDDPNLHVCPALRVKEREE